LVSESSRERLQALLSSPEHQGDVYAVADEVQRTADCAHRSHDVPPVDLTHVAYPEDLALQLPEPTGDDHPEVAVKGFSDAERADPGKWCSCVTGAITEGEYRRALEEAGFEQVYVKQLRPSSGDMPGVFSAFISAVKP